MLAEASLCGFPNTVLLLSFSFFFDLCAAFLSARALKPSLAKLANF